MKIESKPQKIMLQQNDIIRYNGMTYRVDFIQPNGGVYILHELSSGVRIPCMLKNRQYTILMNKRLKNDIKRTVRTIRRYNSRNPRKPVIDSSKPLERIDEESNKEFHTSDSYESSKIHIVESYICEQEISIPSPIPESLPSLAPSTQQPSDRIPETQVENKNETQSSYMSSYCSIM
jgi:hypothetical protein